MKIKEIKDPAPIQVGFSPFVAVAYVGSIMLLGIIAGFYFN